MCSNEVSRKAFDALENATKTKAIVGFHQEMAAPRKTICSLT